MAQRFDVRVVVREDATVLVEQNCVVLLESLLEAGYLRVFGLDDVFEHGADVDVGSAVGS